MQRHSRRMRWRSTAISAAVHGIDALNVNEGYIVKLTTDHNERRFHAAQGYKTPPTWLHAQPEGVRNDLRWRIFAGRMHRSLTHPKRFTEAT